MKGKIVVFLFALPFFGVGVWMGWSIGSNAYDAWRMRAWAPVMATIESAGYESHDGDDSTTYEAYVRYHYEFGGRRYGGNRVGIAGGSDNVGEYQRDTGNRLAAAARARQAVTVYVNPAHAAESIYDRQLRWGLVGFKAIFLLVFGGVGLGLMIYAIRLAPEKDQDDPRYANRPWLLNDRWQGDPIPSNSRLAVMLTWGFAAAWNLISAPLPFLAYREVTQSGNWAAAFGLSFTLVGIALVTWAARRTAEWRRFGRAPVRLDPFPGAIGGHVGGTIDLNLPFDPAARFVATLACIRSHVAGRGNNRNRREDATWQDAQFARATSGPSGTTLAFRFDVPDGLEPSASVPTGDDYAIWRLNVSAELPGADLDRDYEIPVYPTGARSQHLAGAEIRELRAAKQAIDRKQILSLLRVETDMSGRRLLYPAGRNLAGAAGTTLFGAILAAAGWFLAAGEGQILVGAVFGGVGALILMSGIYLAANSLEVRLDGDRLTTVRRLFGIPVARTQMHRADISHLAKRKTASTRTGNRQVIFYSVQAVGERGRRMTLGEGLRGAGQADAAADYLRQAFGLVERPAAESGTESAEDFLADD